MSIMSNRKIVTVPATTQDVQQKKAPYPQLRKTGSHVVKHLLCITMQAVRGEAVWLCKMTVDKGNTNN
jgi:hypothetical protein